MHSVPANQHNVLLCHFFRTLGLTEMQLDSMRSEMEMCQGWNVKGAFKVLDRHGKGFISQNDLQDFMMKSDTPINTADSLMLLTAMSTSSRKSVDLSHFASLLTNVDNYNDGWAMRRLEDELDGPAYKLLNRFLRLLLQLSSIIEESKRNLEPFNPNQLFRLIDVDSKGSINRQSIENYMKRHGTVDSEMMQAVKKYLFRNEIEVLFPVTFSQFIAPTNQPNNNFVKHCQQVDESFQNLKWRFELQRHRNIRHKILDSVTERSRIVRTVPEQVNAISTLPNESNIIQEPITRHINTKCQELTHKIEELKMQLISEVQGRRYVSPQVPFLNRSNTERAFKATSPKHTLTTNHKTCSMWSVLGQANQQLLQQKARRVLLEKELNRSRGKVETLQKEVKWLKKDKQTGTQRLIKDLLEFAKKEPPRQTKQCKNSQPIFKTKSRYIDLEMEHLRRRLSAERRFRF